MTQTFDIGLKLFEPLLLWHSGGAPLPLIRSWSLVKRKNHACLKIKFILERFDLRFKEVHLRNNFTLDVSGNRNGRMPFLFGMVNTFENLRYKAL